MQYIFVYCSLKFKIVSFHCRSMCDRFNIGKGTGVRNVRKVSDVLFQLAPLFIKWPNDAEKEEISRHFSRTNKFPNIIGAIDGTYIKIPMPKENGRSYICRKNFAAVTLQVKNMNFIKHDWLQNTFFLHTTGHL